VTSHGETSFKAHLFDELLEAGQLLSLFFVGDGQESEVVGHDEIPLFQFVEHLQLFGLGALGLVDTIVIPTS
jgi:hypothetical protein